MDVMNGSVNVLNGAIAQKLGMISNSMSTSELSEIHSFLKEAKGIRETILSLGCTDQCECGFEDDDYLDMSGEDFINTYAEACMLIKTLYSLIDDHKIEETQSQWVFDEVREFMEASREAFGARIPELPTMRVVSTTKKTKNKKNNKTA